MNRRLRIIVGVLILALSITLLIWGFMPLDRITRTEPVSPSDLRLPTPTSLQIPPILVS